MLQCVYFLLALSYWDAFHQKMTSHTALSGLNDCHVHFAAVTVLTHWPVSSFQAWPGHFICVTAGVALHERVHTMLLSTPATCFIEIEVLTGDTTPEGSVFTELVQGFTESKCGKRWYGFVLVVFHSSYWLDSGYCTVGDKVDSLYCTLLISEHVRFVQKKKMDRSCFFKTALLMFLTSLK